MNWWNWRPLLAAISRSGILEEETIERLGYNGATEVSPDEAQAIASYLRHALDPKEGDLRLGLDGAWSQTPDDGTFYRAPEDAGENYGLRREVLADFIAFCERSGGFMAY